MIDAIDLNGRAPFVHRPSLNPRDNGAIEGAALPAAVHVSHLEAGAAGLECGDTC